MFTGIVEEVGVIRELRFLSESAVVTIAAGTILPGLKIGDSVAVNGVCLTVTRILPDSFICDISTETLRLTAFKQTRTGAKVNLERAVSVGDRLGGHIMQGHVDAVGRLVSKIPAGEGFDVTFSFPQTMERYLVYKGSIAVNGISLTIASLGKETFSVAVIPHTFSVTTLGQLAIGDPVNLEADILGRYFERYFELGLLPGAPPASKITASYLKEQGF